MNEFKDVLKYLRTRENLSQLQLANKLNISKSTVSMYEVGNRKPDYDTLEAIADYFKVDMNFLLKKKCKLSVQGMKSCSKRIHEAIKKSGYSYGELSNLTGIPKSALQRYATGETTKVPINRIELISKHTNVSTAYLLGLEDRFSAEHSILAAKVAETPALSSLVKIYLGLNETGRSRLMDNANDLSKIYSK